MATEKIMFRLRLLRVIKFLVVCAGALVLVYLAFQSAEFLSVVAGIVSGVIVANVIASDKKREKDVRVLFNDVYLFVATSVFFTAFHVHYFDALGGWLREWLVFSDEGFASGILSVVVPVAAPWFIFAVVAFGVGKILALVINVVAPTVKTEGFFDVSQFDVNTDALANKLKKVYDNAPPDDSTTMIRLFGILYGPELENDNISITKIAENSVGHSYHAEISKGVRLARYVNVNEQALKLFVEYE